MDVPREFNGTSNNLAFAVLHAPVHTRDVPCVLHLELLLRTSATRAERHRDGVHSSVSSIEYEVLDPDFGHGSNARRRVEPQPLHQRIEINEPVAVSSETMPEAIEFLREVIAINQDVLLVFEDRQPTLLADVVSLDLHHPRASVCEARVLATPSYKKTKHA